MKSLRLRTVGKDFLYSGNGAILYPKEKQEPLLNEIKTPFTHFSPTGMTVIYRLSSANSKLTSSPEHTANKRGGARLLKLKGYSCLSLTPLYSTTLVANAIRLDADSSTQKTIESRRRCSVGCLDSCFVQKREYPQLLPYIHREGVPRGFHRA